MRQLLRQYSDRPGAMSGRQALAVRPEEIPSSAVETPGPGKAALDEGRHFFCVWERLQSEAHCSPVKQGGFCDWVQSAIF